MATDKDYLQYVLEQFSITEDVTYRPMMGEYLLYYKGKLIGGVYDDRMLIKITPASEKRLSGAPRELPYGGGKEMLLLDLDGRDDLPELLEELYQDLPEPKKKHR